VKLDLPHLIQPLFLPMICMTSSLIWSIKHISPMF
jgi:hypothetical protein